MATFVFPSYFLLGAIFLLLSVPSQSAFNITQILDQHSDFSTFNSFLSQTGVAADVNSRKTITVLAMDNGAASAFSGRPAAVLKHLVSVHVGLDYYDMAKFKKMTKKSTVITTLFQTSGLAANQMGHLNVTRDANGDLRIRSAVPGSDFVSNIVKEVMTRPYDISVLQISSVIVPPGIENINTTSAPPPKPSRNATSPAPGPSHSHKNKTSAPVPAPSSDDDVAPAPSDDDGAPTPASDPPGSDDADAPGPADDDDASSAPRGAGSFVGAVATGVICAAAAAAAAAAL